MSNKQITKTNCRPAPLNNISGTLLPPFWGPSNHLTGCHYNRQWSYKETNKLLTNSTSKETITTFYTNSHNNNLVASNTTKHQQQQQQQHQHQSHVVDLNIRSYDSWCSSQYINGEQSDTKHGRVTFHHSNVTLVRRQPETQTGGEAARGTNTHTYRWGKETGIAFSIQTAAVRCGCYPAPLFVQWCNNSSDDCSVWTNERTSCSLLRAQWHLQVVNG